MAAPERRRGLALPYSSDTTVTFSALRDLPGAVLLDSGCGLGDSGRFDIMAAAPDPQRSAHLDAAPDAAAVDAFFRRLHHIHVDASHSGDGINAELPFCGGLIGYLGYDAGMPLHGLPVASAGSDRDTLPAAHVGYYPWAIVQDHARRTSTLVAENSVPDAALRDIVQRVHSADTSIAQFHLDRGFSTNMPRQAYAAAFSRVSQYIHDGDCYQVNLAQRFSASYAGDPFTAYRMLRPLAAAAFAGYVDIKGGGALLCLSPERFLSLHAGRVSTQPIKGTRPRSDNPAQDRDIARELQESSKDRAENLMIVDLLRNDLGRNCRPGSIEVEALFALRSYPTVHHLVSTIRGELEDGRSAIDLLRDSFPGGSVTGAPKRRAMQVIAELEPDPRQAYCGSLFYLCNSGRMDSNILIRSLLADRGQLHCWAGGGLVADSCWEAEYQETFDKVGAFLQALEATLPAKKAQ